MSAPALERCVGDVRRFATEHWGRSALLHHAGPDAFEDLLSLGAVDRLVTESLLRVPELRLVKDGTPLDPTTYTHTVRIGGRPLERTARPDKVADAFAEGATIVLQALHRQRGPVGGFCRALEIALTHPVQANAYVTPPAAQGFAVHHDTHDVFVLQTHGRKAWRVYRPVVELAGPDQPWSKDLGEPEEVVLEAELAPGDALYIPRGFPHSAQAQEGVSVHVTVGILATTWADVWRRVMRRVTEHRSFREPLPPGFAADPESLSAELEVRRKELHEWLEEAAGAEAIDAVAERFWRTRRTPAGGRIVGLERLEAVDATTVVRRVPDTVFRIETEGDRAVVILGLRELRLPSFCEPALRAIADRDAPFTAADLPGPPDEPSRVTLVRRLLREGALEAGGLDEGRRDG